jgi:hypothetical protein
MTPIWLPGVGQLFPATPERDALITLTAGRCTTPEGSGGTTCRWASRRPFGPFRQLSSAKGQQVRDCSVALRSFARVLQRGPVEIRSEKGELRSRMAHAKPMLSHSKDRA